MPKRNSIVDYWLTKDGLLLISGWARDGLTYDQIAKDKLKISTSTFCVWRHKYQEFEEALKRNGEIVDREVENALIKRALGYEYEETKTIIEKDNNGKNDQTNEHRCRA